MKATSFIGRVATTYGSISPVFSRGLKPTATVLDRYAVEQPKPKSSDRQTVEALPTSTTLPR